MPKNDENVDISTEDKLRIIINVFSLPLAKMINAGEIDPETITPSEVISLTQTLGTKQDNALELYIDKIPNEITLIRHCLETGAKRSAIVLLFTLLEGEINALTRMHLSIRGFKSKAITNALQGINFEAKFNILLPLLGVSVPERIRNMAIQCKGIRNPIVHNKASPKQFSDSHEKESDYDNADNRADKFFIDNPVDRIEHDLRNFISEGINENPDYQLAVELLSKVCGEP